MYSNVVERIQKLQESHKDSGKGKLIMKESLKEYVIKANQVTGGAVKPGGGELVAKPFRMNSFVPINAFLMIGTKLKIF